MSLNVTYDFHTLCLSQKCVVIFISRGTWCIFSNENHLQMASNVLCFKQSYTDFIMQSLWWVLSPYTWCIVTDISGQNPVSYGRHYLQTIYYVWSYVWSESCIVWQTLSPDNILCMKLRVVRILYRMADIISRQYIMYEATCGQNPVSYGRHYLQTIYYVWSYVWSESCIVWQTLSPDNILCMKLRVVRILYRMADIISRQYIMYEATCGQNPVSYGRHYLQTIYYVWSYVWSESCIVWQTLSPDNILCMKLRVVRILYRMADIISRQYIMYEATCGQNPVSYGRHYLQTIYYVWSYVWSESCIVWQTLSPDNILCMKLRVVRILYRMADIISRQYIMYEATCGQNPVSYGRHYLQTIYYVWSYVWSESCIVWQTLSPDNILCMKLRVVRILYRMADIISRQYIMYEATCGQNPVSYGRHYLQTIYYVWSYVWSESCIVWQTLSPDNILCMKLRVVRILYRMADIISRQYIMYEATCGQNPVSYGRHYLQTIYYVWSYVWSESCIVWQTLSPDNILCMKLRVVRILYRMADIISRQYIMYEATCGQNPVSYGRHYLQTIYYVWSYVWSESCIVWQTLSPDNILCMNYVWSESWIVWQTLSPDNILCMKLRVVRILYRMADIISRQYIMYEATCDGRGSVALYVRYGAC